jgi:adenine-specific DNA-methyltransferase
MREKGARSLNSSESPRYLGSKARLVGRIAALLGEPSEEAGGVFVDAFCGTGAVATAAADLGWQIRLNDHLPSSVALARARLLADPDVPFEVLGSYGQAIAKLNAAASERGFFWREYSPASKQGRMYFTEANARKIDAARTLISGWRAAGALSPTEYDLLTADLILACARVANTAGTYGCYLNHWTAQARSPFALVERELRVDPVPHEVYSVDAGEVPVFSADVAYFDPPYTKRQYAAYYHINETLFHGDEPELIGKTGLRPWRDKASPYCYKARAHDALVELLAATPASRVLLSYSAAGHVDLAKLTSAPELEGEVSTHLLGTIGRYRPNQKASAAGEGVEEFLVVIDKEPIGSTGELQLA